MTIMLLYLMYFGIMLLAMCLQIAIKMNSFKTRMASIKVIFNAREYFEDDWLSIICSFISILLLLFLLPEIETHYPGVKGWIRALSALAGYSNTSLLTWGLSQFDKRIKAAGEYKASIAGEATGTGDQFTPAAKPVKPDSSPKI